MYQNHFVQFSRLGEQALGTNGKYIRYASFRFFFLQIDTTSIAENFTQYAVTVHSQRLRLF